MGSVGGQHSSSVGAGLTGGKWKGGGGGLGAVLVVVEVVAVVVVVVVIAAVAVVLRLVVFQHHKIVYVSRILTQPLSLL